jgi:hypothetical protein
LPGAWREKGERGREEEGREFGVIETNIRYLSCVVQMNVGTKKDRFPRGGPYGKVLEGLQKRPVIRQVFFACIKIKGKSIK